MNGKKAKLLRKIVYGDLHHKKSRKYGAKRLDDKNIHIHDENNESGYRTVTVERYMIVSNIERQQYQKLKKMATNIALTPFLKRLKV